MMERSFSRRVLEIATAALLGALLLVVALRFASALQGPWDLAPALIGAALGALLTDFISGLVHWLCDTYGDEHTPLLGPLLIAPFREHHRHPQRMVGRSLLEVNASNCAGAVGVLALAIPLTASQPGAPVTVSGQAFLFALTLTIYLTNTFHQWAHDARSPQLARILQKSRLTIDPRRHSRHHVAGYGAFCITTGWLNPLLDRFHVFPNAERVVARLGFRPSSASRGSASPGSACRSGSQAL